MALTSEGVEQPPMNLFRSVLSPCSSREPPSQKCWTMTLRKTLSWGLVWGEAKDK